VASADVSDNVKAYVQKALLTTKSANSVTTMAEHLQSLRFDPDVNYSSAISKCWFSDDVSGVPAPRFFTRSASECKGKPEKRSKDNTQAGVQSVQEWVTSNLVDWSAGFRGVPQISSFKDGSDLVSYGTRKPDNVHRLLNKPDNWFYITAIGDNKKSRNVGSDEFTDAEKGHVVDLMESLLRQQLFRHCLTGYLMDGRIIQFFRITVDRSASSPFTITDFVESPVLFLHSDGGKWLRSLLCATPVELGYDLPSVDFRDLQLTAILGTGSSAVVYKASAADGEEVVVKVFHSGWEKMLLKEASNLRGLHGLANIPVLLHEDAATCALVLSPVGIQLACTASQTSASVKGEPSSNRIIASADVFCSLLDTLKGVHERGFVHRDVCLSNFFAVGRGTVLLNDFGCAVPKGTVTSFSGSLQMAGSPILDAIIAKKAYTPVPSDDLHMVVHSLFHRISPAVCAGVLHERDASEIRTFWNSVMVPSLWSEMLEMANLCDYERMKAAIRRMVR
jgi:hypothetical protein